MTKTAAEEALQESIRVVWHSPTEYDALTHGPPYLSSRSASAFAKSASAEQPNLTPYTALLGLLQAAALVHQTHHWSCRGQNFFADHLLFERIYNESLPGIDQLAERAIGLGQPLAVSAQVQASAIQAAVASWGDDPLNVDQMVQKSLSVETVCLQGLSAVLSGLEQTGQLSHGTSNLLEGLADTHETFVYLLKQRAQTVTASAYTYRR